MLIRHIDTISMHLGYSVMHSCTAAQKLGNNLAIGNEEIEVCLLTLIVQYRDYREIGTKVHWQGWVSREQQHEILSYLQDTVINDCNIEAHGTSVVIKWFDE